MDDNERKYESFPEPPPEPTVPPSRPLPSSQEAVNGTPRCVDDSGRQYDRFTETETRTGGTIPPSAEIRQRRFRPLEGVEPKLGERLAGRYEVLDELGRGGMGIVYRCRDTVADVEVAVKALPFLLSNNHAEMEEVKENFKLVEGLVHQNIAVSKTLERDASNGAYYLVMELVDGVELRRWMRTRCTQDGTIPLDAALPILRQVAAALDYAHAKKIIHRDIKPANIMVCKNGLVKVMDFGIAAQIHTSLSRVSQEVHSTSGTHAYMSPEQWRGKPQSTATDQYALAAMAYEMLAGRLPFDATDSAVMREVVLNEPPEPVKGLAETANRALMRALAKEPADRFISCGEFVSALAGEPTRISPSDVSKGEVAKAVADPMQFRQEVYLLQADLRKRKSLIDSTKHDRGETFGAHLDSLERNFIAAEGVMAETSNEQRFALAHVWYKNALKEVEWITTNAPLRKKAKERFPEVEAARAKAETNDARKLVPAEYEQADQQLTAAKQACQEGRFQEAVDELDKAQVGFKQSAVNARAVAIGNHLEAGQTALSQGKWAEVRKAADEVLALEADNADAKQLKATAAEAEKKEKINNLLAVASRAFRAADWKKVQTIADQILELDPNRAEAEYFKQEAEKYNQKSGLFSFPTFYAVTFVIGVLLLLWAYLFRSPSTSDAPKKEASSSIEAKHDANSEAGMDYAKKDRKNTDGTEVSFEVEDDEKGNKILYLGGISLKLIKVKAGRFQMGSPNEELGRLAGEIQHWVTLTKDYWLGETEVTQGQWKAIMGENPSGFDIGDNYPVENVSWNDAMEYCRKLNEKYRGKLPDGFLFSLPTEAQWEYACRAGTTTSLNSEQNITSEKGFCLNLDAVGWYNGNSGDSTHPVGKKMKNAWGFYDMHGNVWEWCSDFAGHSEETTDPVGPSNGSFRVIRGGAWCVSPHDCRSAQRSCMLPEPFTRIGFRLALVSMQKADGSLSSTAGEKTAVVSGAYSENSKKTYDNGSELDVGNVETIKLNLSNDIFLKLIKVKAGRFQMGSPNEELGRLAGEIQHWVTLTKDYWLGETEVTQGQWRAVMGNNPSYFKKGDDYPVENVSWDDAMRFCEKLNEQCKGKLPSGYAFSLPTEAQWEYACRAGTTTSPNSGKNITSERSCPNLDDVGWYGKNSGDSTHPVGQKQKNAWGFYDMHGNVWEWCSDWYGSYAGDATDPKGPANGSYRVGRGGSWISNAQYCRSAARYYGTPSYRFNYCGGFRVVLAP